MYAKWVTKGAIGAAVLIALLACRMSDVLIVQVQETPTRTRTPRPTLTPLVVATDTPVPTITPTPAPTSTATRRPPTARPPTAKPPPVVLPPPGPAVSNMEFHVNPPTCAHSGLAYIKGIVYLNKNDPSQRYNQAIVAMGSSDGSQIWDRVLSDYDGSYTFVLGGNGEAKPGSYWVWLVDPSLRRKSDIGGPIVMNGFGPDNPAACWAGSVDFWK